MTPPGVWGVSPPRGAAAWPPLFCATDAAPALVTLLQAGDAVPDVQLDELVGGEIKQRSLKELFAGKKVGHFFRRAAGSSCLEWGRGTAVRLDSVVCLRSCGSQGGEALTLAKLSAHSGYVAQATHGRAVLPCISVGAVLLSSCGRPPPLPCRASCLVCPAPSPPAAARRTCPDVSWGRVG